MISFNAFDQFHPAMAPQCISNNYPWSHYCCTIVFIHTMRCWKKNDWGVRDGAGRNSLPYLVDKNRISIWILRLTLNWREVWYSWLFFNDHNIGQTKKLENALVILLCRNSIIHIIHKQHKIRAAGKTGTAAPTATNATSGISNTSLTSTSTASDSTTSSLINANKITGCS